MEALKSKAQELLAAGTVKVVIGYGKGTGENRRQLLSYIADHGKLVYVPGLRATAIT